MITFTLVTCTYNAASTLGRTLKSVAAQTWPYVEHIIVDGASTDTTVSMVDAYRSAEEQRSSEHQVVVVSEPDKGLYDAMNKGLRLIHGTYVVFLNAGDMLPLPTTLETIASNVREDEQLPAVLYGDTDIVDAEGHFLRHRRLSPTDRLTWRSFKQGMLVCHQAFYVRSDVARATPYDLRYRYSADVDWCIRVMRDAERRHFAICRVPAVIANYLEGGMSVSHRRASLRERFRLMCRHYGVLPTVAMHMWFVLRLVWKH